MVEETKNDLLLKRTQIIVAILGGIAALIIGLYNVKETIFHGRGLGSLSVNVRSERGDFVGRARVEIYNSQNAVVGSSQTGGDGSYKMKSLSSGNYTLKVIARGFEPQAVSFRIDPKNTTQLDLAMKSIGRGKSSAINSALEDVGASWIKKLGTPQK